MNVAIPSVEFRRAHEECAGLCDAAEAKPLFDSEYIHAFITEFSECQTDAAEWLENKGIDRTCIGAAELLRTLSRAWMLKPLAVYELVGTSFWREAGQLAYEAWSAG